MKKTVVPVTVMAVAIAATSCGSNDDTGVIYRSDEFTVYTDSVVQGDFTAVAISPLEITTNYQSPELSGASSRVSFRFSINSRDNELPIGQSHYALIGDKTSDERIYTFGDPKGDIGFDAEGAELPVDSKWTVRVDMRPILRSFRDNGYYATATGDTIYADDFKGIWLAGSVEPLSWDFVNLYGKHDRKLTDRGDSIYEVTLTVNPRTDLPANPTGWKIDAPDRRFPLFAADQNLVAAMYNMSISDIASNIRPDDTYRAGKEWDGVWTRDVAYSIYLSLAYLDPERSMNSLRAKVQNGHIIQDTGTGGAWPVSSDRVVWGLAAWEIYLATGDKDWLQESIDVLVSTLKADMEVVYDSRFDLMHGEQSYLDWREQTYPRWMQPKDIYESMCLGTNVVFARVCRIVGLMRDELLSDGRRIALDPDIDRIAETGDKIAKSINTYLWMPQEGYYSEYLYGGVYPMKSQATDNLGQALSVILGVASDDMAKSVVSHTPLVPFGTSSVYPQLSDIKPYHNDAVWPFVQAYWNLAAAHTLNMTALNRGIAAIYRAAAMFATNKELYVASNGDYRGTAVNSDSQLWSCAGNAAMVLRVYFGMSLDTDGLHFNPVVPRWLTGEKTLKGVRYRGATLDITLRGTGTEVTSITLDGKPLQGAVVPADIAGNHKVDIEMANNTPAPSEVNAQPQRWAPSVPTVDWTSPLDGYITNGQKDESWQLWINGAIDRELTDTTLSVVAPKGFALIGVVPVVDKVIGFSPRPHEYIPAGSLIIVEAEQFGRPGTKLVADPKKAARFVELTRSPLEFTVNAPADGEYFVDVRYANGAGPINTENKCAIRTLVVNAEPAGPIVMPQRGIGEWLSTGFSNMLPVTLKAGENRLAIAYMPYNENMNADYNTALVDYIRVIRK